MSFRNLIRSAAITLLWVTACGCHRQTRVSDPAYAMVFQQAGYSRQYVQPVVFNGTGLDLNGILVGDASRFTAERLPEPAFRKLVVACDEVGRPWDATFRCGIRVDLIGAGGNHQTLYVWPTALERLSASIVSSVPADSRLLTLISEVRSIGNTMPR